MTRKRKSKWLRISRPRIVISRRGARWQWPWVRIGRKLGLNISRSGISASLRTKYGTLSSRRGCSIFLPGCLLPGLALAAIVVGLATGRRNRPD